VAERIDVCFNIELGSRITVGLLVNGEPADQLSEDITEGVLDALASWFAAQIAVPELQTKFCKLLNVFPANEEGVLHGN
jgi:hypothetical protein